jgi:alpha-L-fucosidase
MAYEPTFESLHQHPVPEWFHDAKFGIFVHWGAYSVPGWALRSEGSIFAEAAEKGWEYVYARNQYAEWYLNTVSIEGSPTQDYHRQTFGEGFSYDRFGPMFNAAMRGWDAESWALLFAAAGARYVVPGTKHHDGFLMWPSEHPNPFKQGWQAERDLIGELGTAVHGRGMRYGLYYSGGLDWTFQGLPIRNIPEMIAAIPQSDAYGRYVDAHWRELIDRYEPAVLWNDIGYPGTGHSERLFADYYNRLPDGLVNNRFDMRGTIKGTAHCDFITPEYSTLNEIAAAKWEACRGIGHSFGYNRNESEADYSTGAALIRLLVDIVSKNGNLLLNVGPTSSGEIPWVQAMRLLEVGAWLRTNGDAIYGTRPWRAAGATTPDGLEVRFTQKAGALYATVLGTPAGASVTVPGVELIDGAAVDLLGYRAPLAWRREGDGIVVELPTALAPSPAFCLRFEPGPVV